MKVTEKQTLEIALGQHSLTGHRKRNEDFYGCIIPEGETLRLKGIALVLADGMGGEKGGREASEYAVKSFLFDYYSTPDTWSVQKSVDRVLGAINQWIYHEGRRLEAVRNMATTFSCLILKGTRYYMAHVGDSRIYRFRDGALKLLTKDHRWEGKDFPNVLTRGIGLDIHLHLDYASDGLQAGDVFAFCSDGVTDWVSDAKIRESLMTAQYPQQACETIAQLALAQGSQDNITCQVVRIKTVPQEDLTEVGDGVEEVPFPHRIRRGMVLDDYELMERIHKGRMGDIYKARDLKSGKTVVLKFPNPLYEDDDAYVVRFLREEWAGKRLKSPWTVRVIPQPLHRRSCLYYVMEYHEGETLRRRLEREGRLPISEAVEIAIQICKGLVEMHCLGIIHRDIKPDNILIMKNGEVKIIDFGVIRVEGLQQITWGTGEKIAPGTPNYMAPELFKGDRGGVQADVFAVGITLYEMLTGRWPYGEVMQFTHPVFREWTPPTRSNPETPAWLETVLKKALERDPENRYEVLTALLYHLEHPEKVPVHRRSRPLLERDPELFWKIAFFIMCGLSLILAILLSQK